MDQMEFKAIEVVKIIQANGYQAVFAGGYVRDMLLNVPSNDSNLLYL